MSKLLNFFRNNINHIVRILLFLITITIIVILLPIKSRFQYEYQKGGKWLHENLYAPFDFAVIKSDYEIKHETDSILSEFKPYFKYDNNIYFSQLNKFKQDFESVWKDYLTNILHYNHNNYDNNYIVNLKSAYLKYSNDLLENIYKNGIIRIPETLNKGNDKSFIFVIEKNNISEENDVSNVFTESSAKNYLKSNVNSKIIKDSITYNIDNGFIEKLNLGALIIPNIIYDNETSSNIKKGIINSISLTKGLIQSGEKIITKGEIIDKNKYNILQSLKKEYEVSTVNTTDTFLIFIGHLFLIITAILVIYLFLFNFRKDILRNNLKTSFILILVLIFVFLASITIDLDKFNIYIIPFAILPIMIRTFYDTRLALFVHIATILIVGFIAPNGFEFVFIQIIAGMIAIFSLASVKKRSQLFLSAILIFCTYCLVYLSISITYEGGLKNIEWEHFLWFSVNSLLLLIAYPLIYIFEKIFGFISDVTLLELSDSNHPLLRELAEKAPGTFQHSLQVANLCEEAIYKIGGNPLLVKAGALYHDIGKIDIPYFFIENQVLGFNPHDEIDFDKSAEIVISHVQHGIALAKKYKLPNQIIDFIKTHHGNSKVQYFYRSFIKKYPESEVEVEKFTYPGPCPFSKETAVLMIADSVEAASRSLKVINEQTISDLVEQIISYQINENLLSDADLTFKDISTIKMILKKKLKNIYHERIEYPH